MLVCSVCDRRVPLCDACVDSARAQLIGIARARGYWWGRAIRTVMRAQPWPTYEASERLQAIAHRKVEDLGDDPRLRDLLARACAIAARQAYQDVTPVPGATSFTLKRR